MEIKDSLGYLLNVSARFMKRNLDNRLSKYNLTTSQWSVIKLLSEENNLTQFQIAERLNADRATYGNIIDILIKKGLVDKHIDEADRRSYVVTLLEGNSELVKEITEEAEKSNSEALKGISESELVEFTTTLKKIINNLGGRKDDII